MRRKISFSIITLLVLGIAYSSEARVDSLTGGLEVGFEMDNRTNKIEDTENSNILKNDDRNRFITTPSLHFKSDDTKDGIDFKYAPGLKYDLNGKGTDVDHKLDLSIQRSLLKECQIKISDLYVNTDDTLRTSDVSNGETPSGSVFSSSGDQISNELGRRRYINNTASLISKYTYLEDSLVTLGYTYSVLRNDDTAIAGGYQDYDKHDGLFSVSYRLNPEWKTILGGQYIRGLYGEQDLAPTTVLSRDLVQYVGDMTLESYIFSKNTLSLSYQYLGTKYDETTRNDSDIQQATLGWKQDVSPHTKFDLGAGPAYEKTEEREAQWGYNAHAKLNHSLEHGKLDLGIEKAFGQDNFSGTNESGFIDFWKVNGGFTHELYKDLSWNVFASYKDEDHQKSIASTDTTATTADSSTQDTYNKKIYENGVKIKYSFWHWYTATAGYTFSRQESDSKDLIDFDEHRVYLSLGVEKELLRW
jgi:hypothetical protein